MKLHKRKLVPNKTIAISGSKSISNRLLILQKLFGSIEISNLSNSEDTQLMQKALSSDSEIIDIHHAGTAMRFLTSYFAVILGEEKRNTKILTGSDRMKQRPIKFLVDALRDLGAEIIYLENDGFPPIKITGKKIEKNRVKIPANISSQFISSLILVAGKLERGLEIELSGEITSRPYLEMTLKLLSEIGIQNTFTDNKISVLPTENRLPETINYTVESDWSSASYWYSLAAIGKTKINLKSFKKDSLQGDSALVWIYEKYFGIKTEWLSEDEISLVPIPDFNYPERIEIDMNPCPDIAQTLCVTASALKIPFEISGLATLKVKETDRLLALKNELYKIGCEADITENTIKSARFFEPENKISIGTYNDHRMAMSFAPFALVKEIEIENPEVVEKSYPDFWRDFESVTGDA